MTNQESFGQTLKRIRQAKGWNQRHLASLMGMDFSYYSRLEGDRVGTPTRETIVKVADALGVEEIERNELLAAAGRVAEEMHGKPALRSLYKAAASLSEEDLQELVEEAERRLREKDTV